MVQVGCGSGRGQTSTNKDRSERLVEREKVMKLINQPIAAAKRRRPLGAVRPALTSESERLH